MLETFWDPKINAMLVNLNFKFAQCPAVLASLLAGAMLESVQHGHPVWPKGTVVCPVYIRIYTPENGESAEFLLHCLLSVHVPNDEMILLCCQRFFVCLSFVTFSTIQLHFSHSASSTSDLSFIAGNQSKDVSGMPDPLDAKSANLVVIPE